MAASNGSLPEQQFAQVLAALATMQGNAEREQKRRATDYLEQFQKSPEAWAFSHAVLQSPTIAVEAKLFAASTMKGKIQYDLPQLPRDSLVALRDSLISLLVQYRSGARPIRTQLCVCLSGLALQMVEWKDVISMLVAALGTDAQSSVVLLEFLTVLPEEVGDGRKISLSEDELDLRTQELLVDNAPRVLQLLLGYAQSTANQEPNPALLTCLNSWLREIPCSDVVKTPLVDVVFSALSSESAFDTAVDCICSFFRETREVDESTDVILQLYPRIIALRPKIAEAADSEDVDVFKGYTRLFAEAGEAWTVLIARMPADFRGLVEAIEECARRDTDREVMSLTFNFWYDLKNYVVLENYMDARLQLADIYARLVDIMISHLQYPYADEADLFEGDREAEEKFRTFRHSMGDVLKDCCEVVGHAECLGKAFGLIKAWMQDYQSKGAQATPGHVPDWQKLEAPLFSLRAMGRMVPNDEQTVLPQIMSTLVHLPEHEKVRFAATLVLGRYTEWTAQHPQYLELQLNYITNGFQNSSKEVAKAAAMALKFFCQDCGKLLVDHVAQLHQFYEQVAPDLPLPSLYEITDGVAHVVAAQPLEKIYDALHLFCEPITQRLVVRAQSATDHDKKCDLAGKNIREPGLMNNNPWDLVQNLSNCRLDHIQLLTIFVQVVHPHIPEGVENPMIRFWANVVPVLSAILNQFVDSLPVCERIARCFRAMLISYRTDMLPLLPQLADQLVAAFEKSNQGCFLWVSGAIVREFADDELVDKTTKSSVYQFLERQCVSMFRLLNDTLPQDIPDVIEDFFRLLADGMMFHPTALVTSSIFQPVIEACLASLSLEQIEPLISVLQFLRDVLAYGRDSPPTSIAPNVAPEVKETVRRVSLTYGERLTHRIFSGLLYSFPRDCTPDASGAVLALIELHPQESLMWITGTFNLLPPGSITGTEANKFLGTIQTHTQNQDYSKIRYTLRDFIAWYRRKNVNPRSEISGVGTEERFKFGG